MAGWNSILGRASNHSVNEAQQKMVDEANRIMQETRRINAKTAIKQTYGYGAGGHIPTIQVADDISTDSWRMRALGMRLHISEGHQFPFQHVSTAWTGEKVFVFVVEHGQAVTLEDDANLFPSDVLITQLRLIAK